MPISVLFLFRPSDVVCSSLNPRVPCLHSMLIENIRFMLRRYLLNLYVLIESAQEIDENLDDGDREGDQPLREQVPSDQIIIIIIPDLFYMKPHRGSCIG